MKSLHPLARLDREFVWHPFTQMRDWLRTEPIVIVGGRGAVLEDARGRQYLDANSSIWTNLHGHRNPRLDRALRRQLGRISHSSALGLANEPASRLAADLVRVANPSWLGRRNPGNAGTTKAPEPRLARVFYSDDGSTAIEVALKLSWEFARRTRGQRSPRFLSLRGAYHGDTLGAVALGHLDQFHAAFGGMLFKADAVMAPYCYRCPFNRARPERADARVYRKCGWECVGKVEAAFERARRRGRPYAGFVVEPRMQGAAGMVPQPPDWLRRSAGAARDHGALVIADEVMTGLGRTGADNTEAPRHFACHHEDVQPDFLCLAKGLAAGYLPFAATLTTQAVFDAFLGEYEEFKTFFHGHSFTANQLGAAVARESLALLTARKSVARRLTLQHQLTEELRSLWDLPIVGDIRQEGLVAGIELVRDWRTRERFALGERVGMRVCDAMARRGVLTRPIGDVLVLMPPYCTSRAQLRRMVAVMAEGIREIGFGERKGRWTG